MNKPVYKALLPRFPLICSGLIFLSFMFLKSNVDQGSTSAIVTITRITSQVGEQTIIVGKGIYANMTCDSSSS